MLDVVLTVTVPAVDVADTVEMVMLESAVTLKEPTAVLAEAPDTINSMSASDSPKALLENADRVNIYSSNFATFASNVSILDIASWRAFIAFM